MTPSEGDAGQVGIRYADAPDAPWLAELSRPLVAMHASAHPEVFAPFDPTAVTVFFLDQLARPDVMILLAETGQTAVGYLMAQVLDHPTTPLTRSRRALHIQHLVVADAVQRRGVATALLREADRDATQAGCATIQLSCWDFNTPAQDFFGRRGFQTTQLRMTRPVRRLEP